MNEQALDPLYKVFGELVRLHRERQEGLTQEKLGRLVGLSRTSITNIEKGRQHVALHQLLDLAEALEVQPEALLPKRGKGATASWLADKLPPGTEKEIAEWAEKLSRE
jgi:transcriptional regulator with XRE-family HTH domain